MPTPGGVAPQQPRKQPANANANMDAAAEDIRAYVDNARDGGRSDTSSPRHRRDISGPGRIYPQRQQQQHLRAGDTAPPASSSIREGYRIPQEEQQQQLFQGRQNHDDDDGDRADVRPRGNSRPRIDEEGGVANRLPPASAGPEASSASSGAMPRRHLQYPSRDPYGGYFEYHHPHHPHHQRQMPPDQQHRHQQYIASRGRHYYAGDAADVEERDTRPTLHHPGSVAAVVAPNAPIMKHSGCTCKKSMYVMDTGPIYPSRINLR